jgi:hypothetical protein
MGFFLAFFNVGDSYMLMPAIQNIIDDSVAYYQDAKTLGIEFIETVLKDFLAEHGMGVEIKIAINNYTAMRNVWVIPVRSSLEPVLRTDTLKRIVRFSIKHGVEVAMSEGCFIISI